MVEIDLSVIKAVDIAVNITYMKDYELIIKKSFENGVLPIFVGTDTESNKKVIELAEKYNTFCYVGYHPNHLEDFVDFDLLEKQIKHKRVIAIGECGLDYYRNSDKTRQIEVFRKILNIKTEKPYFLHLRDAFDDFMIIVDEFLIKNKTKFKNSVVHSFDGTTEEAKKLIKKGFKIGINGCSMKKNTNVVKELDLNDILIETDSPFCRISKSYAAAKFCNVVKAKQNEPAMIFTVAEAISNIKGIELKEVLTKTTETFKNLYK